MRGRYTKSPEHRAKLAEAARQQAARWRESGLPAPNKGIKLSEETRRKMSASRIGNTYARTHGLTNTRAHQSWRDMLGRIRQVKYPGYHRYGGRGITVCERWFQFENFYADMGERPKGTTLDRIDNDGNYEPGNCRWATTKEQAANRTHPNRRKARSAI